MPKPLATGPTIYYMFGFLPILLIRIFEGHFNGTGTIAQNTDSKDI